MAKPFVKWAGGKGSQAETLLALFPKKITRYFEPFLGGGAMFFALRESGFYGKATLGDCVGALMNAYTIVRDSPEALGKLLSTHSAKHFKGENPGDYFSKIRVRFNASNGTGTLTVPSSQVQRAADFLYLNRVCFNGLYRVNRKGLFNVPFGSYSNPSIYDQVRIDLASDALHNTELLGIDYRSTLRKANRSSDFVYMDPPYWPLTKTANFASYSPDSFGEADHEKLAGECRILDSRGVSFALSNHDTPEVRKLWKGFKFTELQARRNINSKASARGLVGELLIRNYK